MDELLGVTLVGGEARGGGRGFLVQFGFWFNVKPFFQIGLILNYLPGMV